MNARIRRSAVAVAAAAILPLALVACSDDGDSGSSDSAQAASSAPAAGEDQSADTGGDMAGADEPFGPACSSVPKDGAGSFDGMAKDPVATAASNNPALSTLVTAVKKAGLV
ncbi:fasciclin domain-containing protein, partial [Streptomyces sp. NPDC057781]